MERQASDISLIARRGFLIYGNGYTSKIVGITPTKDQQENDVLEFVLDPSEELIKKYKIKPSYLSAYPNNPMVYIVQYPCELVIQLNPDPSWTRWFYLKTYDGIIPPSSKLLLGTTQQEIIQKLKQQIILLTTKLEVAEENYDLMQLNMPKFLKRNVEPMITQMLPLVEKMTKKTE